MRILPTAAKPDAIKIQTYPAPPNKDSGDATYIEPLDYRGKGLKPRLQRSYWGSNSKNTITLPPVVLADWVMEEEIPTGQVSFLGYPTRRCFMEDRIQIRVQINGVQLNAGTHVEIKVVKPGRVTDDIALFIDTHQAAVDAARKAWYRERRPLQASADLSADPPALSDANILFEISNTDPNVSFLLTSIRLPAQPDDEKRDDMEYVFRVRVSIAGRVIDAESPVLRVMRWWARPDKNLDQVKTRSTVIEPLVDGENYFAKCEAMIQAAASTIYIAGWSFYLDTYLTGEPGMGGVQLSDLLLQKARAGVKVYIMLGEIRNAEIALAGIKSPLLTYNGAGDKNDLSCYNVDQPAFEHPNIHIKIHKHPLKVKGETLGSIHEKYVLTDGNKAALGGIDFQPNRYQSQAHDWKSDSDAFEELSDRRMRYNATTQTEAKELFEIGKEVDSGVAGADGRIAYRLPTYLPAANERAVLGWFAPETVDLDVTGAGTPEDHTIASGSGSLYYLIRADGATLEEGHVPEDKKVDYTLPAGTTQAELLWWDMDQKPTLVDLDFAFKGALQHYTIQDRSNRACPDALWILKAPRLVSTFSGMPEGGDDRRWHDAAVYVEGDAAINVAHDFARRWNIAGADLGQSEPPDPNFHPEERLAVPVIVQTANPRTHNAQVAKTADWHFSGDCKYQGAFDAYKQAIREARHYVYIENQYFTHPELGDELTTALKKNPHLQVMVIVPFETEEAAKIDPNKAFKSQTVLTALFKMIKGEFDPDKMQDRGVRHQQWLQAQLINRIRAVPNADKRVGVFVLAGQLDDQANPRNEDYVFDDRAGNVYEGVVWRLEVDGARADQGVSGADGKATFTIPANTRNVFVEGWELPDPDTQWDNLDLSGKGAPEDKVIRDSDGNPAADVIWTLMSYKSGKLTEGKTDDTGDVDFTLPADTAHATLAVFDPQTEDVIGMKKGVTIRKTLRGRSGSRLPGVYWALSIDGIPVNGGRAQPDGKIGFTLPKKRAASMVLQWWDRTTPTRTYPLDLDLKGTPEQLTLPDPKEDAFWEIHIVKERRVAGGVTEADGEAAYTIPADAERAVLNIWAPRDPTWRKVYDAGAQMIYPHSKVMVVDDTWAIVGSTNANGRSFVTDEEINIVFHDRAVVTRLRKSLWQEHLGVDMDTRDIRTFFQTWKRVSGDPVDEVEDCDPQKVTTVHAVKLGNPPEGQEYNGPLSKVIDMGKMV